MRQIAKVVNLLEPPPNPYPGPPHKGEGEELVFYKGLQSFYDCIHPDDCLSCIREQQTAQNPERHL